MEQTVGSNAVNAQNLGAMGHGAGGAVGGLSPVELFVHASFVVKLVMLGLVLASILVWAIIIAKVLLLRRVNHEATAFEDRFWAGGSLDTLYETEGARPIHPMAAVFGAAMGEWRRSARILGDNMARGAAHERIERAIEITVLRESDRLSRYLTILATIGPVAPFVGLFGTVWGIMHAFTAIAGQNNTSLAVVAPGISEALFATALGLFTAVPAYIAYNILSHSVDQFGDRMDMFGTEFSAILSRQSEERKMGEG